jgi:hypothetical protein
MQRRAQPKPYEGETLARWFHEVVKLPEQHMPLQPELRLLESQQERS